MADRPANLAAVAAAWAAHDAEAARPALAWLFPEHAERLDTVLAGEATTSTLPARVAVALLDTMDHPQRETATAGETRRSVLAASGATLPPRASGPPAGATPAVLRRWLEARTKLDPAAALAVIDSAPDLAADVYRRAQHQARIALYIAASEPGFTPRPAAFLEDVERIGSESATHRVALHKAWAAREWFGHAAEGPDPAWWRLTEATVAVGGVYWELPQVPERLWAELVARTLDRDDLDRSAILTWLARSGAGPDTVIELVPTAGSSSLAGAALAASDRATATLLAEAALGTAPAPHSVEPLLFEFSGELSTGALIAGADTLASARVRALTERHPLEFLWDLAGARGRTPVTEAMFGALCDHLRARHTELFDEVVTLDEPWSVTDQIWRGRADLHQPALRVLARERARVAGWRSLLDAAERSPASAAALTELLDAALVRAGSSSAAAVFALELLEGWPGTLAELAATVAACDTSAAQPSDCP